MEIHFFCDRYYFLVLSEFHIFYLICNSLLLQNYTFLVLVLNFMIMCSNSQFLQKLNLNILKYNPFTVSILTVRSCFSFCTQWTDRVRRAVPNFRGGGYVRSGASMEQESGAEPALALAEARGRKCYDVNSLYCDQA